MSRELRKVGFHRLWVGETISVFGSHFTIFAVPLIAVTVLEATPLEMGMLNAANSAAVLVFGLSAGVIADRFRKRPVMVAGNLLRAVALLVGPALHFAGLLNIWALMGLMFVVGVGGILTDSAYSAFVYELVPRKHLNSANAWTQGSSSASDAGGPALAGVLMHWLGGPIVLLIDALSYVVTSLFLLTLPPGKTPEPRTESSSHWSEVRSGLASLWRQRVLRLSTVAAAHSNLFHSMFFAVFMIFVVRHLGISEGFIGLVMSVGGIFGLLGARCASPLADRWGCGRVLAVVYAVPGVAAALVPAADGVSHMVAVAMVAASSALWSFSVVINLVISESLKQAFAKPDEISRVTASIRVVSWGIEPFGALAGGFLATSLLPPQALLYVSSVGLFTAALWVLHPAVFTIQSLDTSEQPEPESTAP